MEEIFPDEGLEEMLCYAESRRIIHGQYN